MNENVKNKEASSKIYTVGIGASAGGLEALQKFLSSLPSDTGFPYILVQHLSPDYKSLLTEILSKYTEMPVIQAEEGMDVEPNHVYVIQPGKNLQISESKLVLSPQKSGELNLPINLFFSSLAEDCGANAIAIVLSGTDSDGTNGIKDIKERDGMIIVQSPETSKFDGMPRSAIRTGLVDIQLSPEDIAAEIAHISSKYSKHSLLLPKIEQPLNDDQMKNIYAVLKQISNVNFTHYKQTTIIRRIERRMMLSHKDTLDAYVEYLYDSPTEALALSKEVLIGVTNFFRDPEFFEILKEKTIKEIVQKSSEDEAIRVWVAGCSTSEEAYSIAILFSEVLEHMGIKRDIKIFATDLDKESINIASKGVYGDSIISSVSTSRLSHFFTKQSNTYVVNREIRKMIVFSPHNVIQDPPFGKLDLISCRNMLIYFQPVLQNDLFAIFHQALNDGGYLFLGKSEAIGSFTEAFPVVDSTAKIFTHKSNVKIPGSKTVPYLQMSTFDDDFTYSKAKRYTRISDKDNLINPDRDKINFEVFEQFMPASVVIDSKNNITRVYGDVTNYIHVPTGKFTNYLFDLITTSLKIPVSTILKEAREKKEKVQYKDVNLQVENNNVSVVISALPLIKYMDNEDYYLVVFTENTVYGLEKDAQPYKVDKMAAQRITDLEQNLSAMQEKLSRSVAEQECVSEELQSANEELLTANEELQSSNEELQSVNEELYTVNSEYQQKLLELTSLNDDIANFLSSTLTGIIFVDSKLNLRRYTDYVSREFSVMDHDIGRPLKSISYIFSDADIIEICNNVLKTLIPDEREITTIKHKVFFTRIAPYRSVENKILGCVITLVDITTQKQGEVKLEKTEKKLSDVQDAVAARGVLLQQTMETMNKLFETLSVKVKLLHNDSQDNPNIEEELKSIDDIITTIMSTYSKISK